MQKLTVSGVAQVVVRVTVRLVQREGADDNGESPKRFLGVGGAALAGDDALDVALDGQRDDDDQNACAGGDGHWVLERDGFTVGGERDRAGEPDFRGRPYWFSGGDGQRVALRTNVDGLRQREERALRAGPQCDFVSRAGGLEDKLAIVPKGPHADAQRGAGDER